MKTIIIYMIVLINVPVKLHAQGSHVEKIAEKNVFSSVKQAAKASYRFISENDAKGYCTIMNVDTMLVLFKKRAKNDPLYAQLYEQVSSNRDMMCQIFQSQLSNVRSSIERHYGLIKTMKYVSLTISSNKEDKSGIDYTVSLNVLINNAKHDFMIHVYKYQNNYYIFEPLES